jgi:hypothetical protein
MPFSHSIRVRAMVDAARHCCLCHRHKGVHLEVHHIIPEAQGGPNTYENAIVLCFDCHADAGFYNANHPRGTKITEQELRKARDEWYATARIGNVQAPKELDFLHCRYVIGKHFEFLSEIVQANLQHFPLANSLLVRTPSLYFLGNVVNSHKYDYRYGGVPGDVFSTREQYLEVHADSDIRPTSYEGGFVYFSFERTPSIDEVTTRVASEDPITRLLLEAGVPVRLLTRAVASEDACGGGFPESYRTRPLWGVFLVVTNVSDQHLRLRALTGEMYGRGTHDFHPMHTLPIAITTSISLPEAPIAPGASVIIPVATVLGPLDHIPIQVGYSDGSTLGRAYSQDFTHITTFEERTLASFTWGPTFLPQRVEYMYDGFIQHESVHDLNLDNVYEIDRHWAMGSCPHAFAIDSEGRARYLGEVVPRGCNRVVTDTILVPDSSEMIVIAELEDEVTYLQEIRDSGDLLVADVRLTKGMSIMLRPTSRVITVQGSYSPLGSEETAKPDLFRRNALVADYRATLESRPPTLAAASAT